jgi:uracil phosphoribosyltransferase
MLKETLAFDSEDEKICTGTDTSPKEIVAVAILRAGMQVTQAGYL